MLRKTLQKRNRADDLYADVFEDLNRFKYGLHFAHLLSEKARTWSKASPPRRAEHAE